MAIITRLRDKNLTINFFEKIINIAIKYKWFYCVIIQNRWSIIFSEWCGKTKVERRSKIGQ